MIKSDRRATIAQKSKKMDKYIPSLSCLDTTPNIGPVHGTLGQIFATLSQSAMQTHNIKLGQSFSIRL